ncbi:MAG: O-antigen ligase family protein [Caulobacteraceae bacterium]
MSQSLLNRAPSRPSQVKPAATAAELAVARRYLVGVWILLAVLTPLVGFLGARGFAPAVGVAGLLCLPLVRLRTADMGGLILFGLLVEWAVVSAFWSPAALPHDLKSFGRFTGLHLFQQLLFCGALIVTTRGLTPAGARKALTWVGGGLIALIALLLFDSVTDAWLLGTLQAMAGQKSNIAHWALRTVAQGGYVLVMLFWPVTVGLWTGGRRRLAVAFAVGAILALVLLHVSAPLAALLTSAAMFGLVAWLGRPAAVAGLVFAAAQSLAVPWLMRGGAEGGVFQSLRPRLPPSWAARIDIWTFTSQRMAEKPLFGWGLDASRTFKGNIPLHPHDAPLQLWFELGAVGAVLGALIWAFIFWRFAQAAPRRPLYAAAGCATAWSAMVIGAFSFSLWQEWWICLVALGFAACAVLARQLDDPALKQRSDSAKKNALKQRSDSVKGGARG